MFHGEINQVSIMRDSMYENANQYLHKHLLEYLFFSVINIESYAKQEVVSFWLSHWRIISRHIISSWSVQDRIFFLLPCSLDMCVKIFLFILIVLYHFIQLREPLFLIISHYTTLARTCNKKFGTMIFRRVCI